MAHKWLLVIGLRLRLKNFYIDCYRVFDIHSGVKILPRRIVSQLWPTCVNLGFVQDQEFKIVNRLVVTFKCTSRWENLYCFAIVAHRWLLVIGLCLRIQNQYTH